MSELDSGKQETAQLATLVFRVATLTNEQKSRLQEIWRKVERRNVLTFISRADGYTSVAVQLRVNPKQDQEEKTVRTFFRETLIKAGITGDITPEVPNRDFTNKKWIS